ncbi:uncharacterized protein PHALS_10722 [Plasmopara halstedii]|uniref:Uncharacterized protein n=1 Tax=Plasmopara halstedii TaxID=4781 RepID=A0A0P1AHD4_PLAHL|nr:uncharacterized protein PHALS_10722 [Plasmopara halstedii]CEG40528.1 hypothetical protein PHALS_10722 [Plasmopara halstedii]|eukprot:XP_024576897.1 hypothetical protein PHALS_10722 [Plasmopara halstedii]
MAKNLSSSPSGSRRINFPTKFLFTYFTGNSHLSALGVALKTTAALYRLHETSPLETAPS